MKQLPLIKLPDIVTVACARNRLKKCGDRCYTLRFTIDQGVKFVGKRISISLETKDIVLAEKVAAICLGSLKKGGFRFSAVKFSQPEPDHDNMALLDCVTDLMDEVDQETANLIQAAINKSKSR